MNRARVGASAPADCGCLAVRAHAATFLAGHGGKLDVLCGQMCPTNTTKVVSPILLPSSLRVKYLLNILLHII